MYKKIILLLIFLCCILLPFTALPQDCFPPTLYGAWSDPCGIHLWWEFENGPPDGCVGYMLWRMCSDYPYPAAPIWATNNPNILEYDDTDLGGANLNCQGGDTLQYVIAAVCQGVGSGENSNILSFIPPPPHHH